MAGTMWHNDRMINLAEIDLFNFLIDWHGLPDAPPSALPAECTWLPDPLKEWYSLSGRWTSPLIRLKRMLTPGQIEQSDEKAIFMEDPTGDWFWAFNTEDKITVYDAELHGEWERTAEQLSEFLVHNALNETIYGGKYWRECTQVEAGLVADTLAPMTAVSFGGWRWPRPGGQIFMSKTLLAEVGPAMNPESLQKDRPGYSEVRVTAKEPVNLSYLDRMTSIKWLRSP